VNNNCVVTLMRSDSKQFVNGLVSSLREEYDSVSFLALGTSNDVEVLESKFESVMTLLDLGPDFNACQLIFGLILNLRILKVSLNFLPYLQQVLLQAYRPRASLLKQKTERNFGILMLLKLSQWCQRISRLLIYPKTQNLLSRKNLG